MDEQRGLNVSTVSTDSNYTINGSTLKKQLASWVCHLTRVPDFVALTLEDACSDVNNPLGTTYKLVFIFGKLMAIKKGEEGEKVYVLPSSHFRLHQ